MKGNELVWRSLADRALQGQRTWRNVTELAYDAGVPSTTAYLALERLESNGTVDRYSRGGLAVVSVDKLLTMLCAWRNLGRDTLAWTTREGIDPLLQSDKGPYALGGPDAASTILNGRAVADFSEHIVYLPASANLADLPPGNDVRVLTMDKRAARTWNGYSSLAQTYADLFATPGWQASEFREALRDRFVREREWDQEGDGR
ncbi:hypothetical protein [Microbacterium sp. TNHR37B]|uniref:hypothetical protein n=1 Tax=Microbacterium sp. TNHR37B TaxID=1775956 RepID=UPI0007B26068|nr:hypothetical protein [Microbacterium sp. TNHR37B]KZE89223.1 hypothetical protein AVP41_02016 [Microbacterium sp. TNHR37B]